MKTSIHDFAKGGAVAALLGTMFAGCGGLSPGEYVVYQVSSTESTQSVGCYANGVIPPDVKSDSTTFRDGLTFVVFAGPEDTYYLNAEDNVFEGTVDGDVYTFEGEVVDVNFSGPNGTGDRYTSTTKSEIEVTVDGSLVSGVVKIRSTERCVGATCNPLPPDCTETLEFVGIEVEDVKLKHEVDHDSVSPPPPPPPPPPTTTTTGAGGAGGEGGGGVGGGGPCVTCAETLETGFATSPADVCAASQSAYLALQNCACSTSCPSECSIACDGGAIDSLCNECVGSFCIDQAMACFAQ